MLFLFLKIFKFLKTFAECKIQTIPLPHHEATLNQHRDAVCNHQYFHVSAGGSFSDGRYVIAKVVKSSEFWFAEGGMFVGLAAAGERGLRGWGKRCTFGHASIASID